MRQAQNSRTTSESTVSVSVALDGTGISNISTTGDTHIAVHPPVEDASIVLGQTLRAALCDKAGIRRYGFAAVPLDEALAQCVVDVSGRPYFVHEGEPEGQQYHLIGGHFTG